MKQALFIIALFFTFFSFGQKKEKLNLIKVDSTWGKEIIEIPFWFAPKIKHKGLEDIRFAKGWENIKSPGFWVLAFAWDINLKTKPTAKFFEDNLKFYYNGLMKVVNEDAKITIPRTKAYFTENKPNKKTTFFRGIVETYDAFTTKKMIKLYTTIEVYYCKKTKTYVPLFKFSPKEFKDKTWKNLDKVKLQYF